jgi:hypothetical protein
LRCRLIARLCFAQQQLLENRHQRLVAGAALGVSALVALRELFQRFI